MSQPSPSIVRFDGFTLDVANRRLLQGDTPVVLSGRYLDALALMAAEPGALVTKDRFMAEVWRGVPVTDEALTQCIRSLRRALGDDAARPRYIATVPKHGYRFVAATLPEAADAALPASPADAAALTPVLARVLIPAVGGTIGAGLAGLSGGLAYGFIGAAQPLQPGLGAASVLLVLLCLAILVAVIGGVGVSLGIALAGLLAHPAWRVAGGAVSGLIVGGAAELLGLDAFNLLLGRAPSDITGVMEGALLGGAVGLAAWLAEIAPLRRIRRHVTVAALAGAMAGLAIALAGGRLFAGSLDLLAALFPGSHLRLDAIGQLFGERRFDPLGSLVTSVVEGALFAGCTIGGMLLARRHADRSAAARL